MKMLAHVRQCIVDRIEIISHRPWKAALATPARFDVTSASRPKKNGTRDGYFGRLRFSGSTRPNSRVRTE